jgi:voltage-gated potassium channel
MRDEMKIPLQQTNFIWLTCSLAAMMFMHALTDEFPGIYTFYIIEYGNIILLLVALGSLRTEKTGHRSLLLVIAVMSLIAVAQQFTTLKHLELAYLVLLMIFFIAAVHRVGKQVLMTGSINAHKVVGSIALYLLLGFIWSACYGILLQFSPDAFYGIEYINWRESSADLTYFSFVTLTTLGYGDVSPVAPLARVIVVMEAIAGMFYLAIVVASLIAAMRKQE